jgi:hypothetical protein
MFHGWVLAVQVPTEIEILDEIFGFISIAFEDFWWQYEQSPTSFAISFVISGPYHWCGFYSSPGDVYFFKSFTHLDFLKLSHSWGKVGDWLAGLQG